MNKKDDIKKMKEEVIKDDYIHEVEADCGQKVKYIFDSKEQFEEMYHVMEEKGIVNECFPEHVSEEPIVVQIAPLVTMDSAEMNPEINDELEQELSTKMSIIHGLLHCAFLHVPTNIVEDILSRDAYMSSSEIFDLVERANNTEQRANEFGYEETIKEQYVLDYTNSLMRLTGDLVGVKVHETNLNKPKVH